MIKWQEIDAHGAAAQINGPFITAEVTEIRDGWKVHVNNMPLPELRTTMEEAQRYAEGFVRVLIEETLYDVIQRPRKTGPTRSVQKWLDT
jgi:hypothetical protein